MTGSFIPAPDVTVVTGAAGWLGTALMHALTDGDGPWGRPGTIRPLVRDRVEADRLAALAPTVEPVVGDLGDDRSLDRLFDRSDAGDTVDVIHTAGVIHPRSVDEFFTVNTDGTRRMLERSPGVRRFVHVSSNSPFGTNAHPDDRFRNDEPYHPYYGYGRSKMLAELAVFDAVEHGLDAVVVRPPWFYGPHQPPRQTTFFQMVRKGRFPVFAGGLQARSMVYVDNLVQGVLRAELVATPPGSAWWIADARPYTVAEIVDTVGRALRAEGFDVTDRTLRLPGAVAVAAERADALLQRTGRYQQQIHVLGEMNKNIAVDVSAARDELGYEPTVELYDGMRRSIRWCVEQGYEL
ncbi:MAG: NAD(P)-dependent oxidoreductase [Ilumatobacter sp.]|nr:NAD(P)-dependent oxidoreductase [Ilumatobacter sp.]